MSHDPTDPSSYPDDLELLFRALTLLLSDVLTARFEVLTQRGVDPLEAAAEVMSGLSRYDFLAELKVPGADYPALKRELEAALSTAAGRMTEEQNPR